MSRSNDTSLRQVEQQKKKKDEMKSNKMKLTVFQFSICSIQRKSKISASRKLMLKVSLWPLVWVSQQITYQVLELKENMFFVLDN